MNKIVTTERTGASSVAMSNSGLGAAMKPESLGDIVRFAELMCQSKAGIPAYLHNNPADCMAITLQALQWDFNPFSVAQKSYKVKDVLAFEAQLIAAVVNTRSGIKGRLKYVYSGEGQDLICTVTGVIDDETLEYESPPIGSITTKNSPLWKSDPRQQLGYFSARSWARRHTPEVLLGVYDRDEAQQFQGPDNAKNVTPQTALAKQIAARQALPDEAAQQPQDGFNADFVSRHADEIKNAPQDTPEPDEDTKKSPTSQGDGEAEPESDTSSAGSGSADPQKLYPHNIAKELIASLKLLKSERAISNTWHLQFEDRVARLDEDDRSDIAEIANSFSGFVTGKVEKVALENQCEDLLAQIAERAVEPGDLEALMGEPA